MARSKSSKRWLKEHFDDHFVRESQKKGYRSRAVFKLEELNDRDNLIRANQHIIDLGAAPGGWSEYALSASNFKSHVIGLDILPIDPIEGVEFIQGDFTEQKVLDELLKLLNGQQVDLVLSDMAPNISGLEAVDQPKSMYLCELALELATEVSKTGSNFVCKVFQGSGFDEYLKKVRLTYQTVKIRKPKASRDRSKEVYIVGLGFK
ncbi:MAG: 23S rRNA (uridine(2552)-2'-O)-methyltransferase RlmE [Pseudomonadota bacterium]